MRSAVDSLAAVQFNGRGQHVWSQARVLLESEHQRLAVGQVAVPLGICTEPSNVQAGGGACSFRFRCLGCGHFRSDPSYLPELRDYLDTLLRDRERIGATTELDDLGPDRGDDPGRRHRTAAPADPPAWNPTRRRRTVTA
jgi:hypothetical protein